MKQEELHPFLISEIVYDEFFNIYLGEFSAVWKV